MRAGADSPRRQCTSDFSLPGLEARLGGTWAGSPSAPGPFFAGPMLGPRPMAPLARDLGPGADACGCSRELNRCASGPRRHIGLTVVTVVEPGMCQALLAWPNARGWRAGGLGLTCCLGAWS